MVKSPSSGDVYMMRLVASITLALLPALQACASVESSYSKLNTRIAYCSSSQQPIGLIDDTWLVSLSDDEVKVALLTLKDRAMQKCLETQEKEYLYQLYLDYTHTGNKEPIEAFLALKENHLVAEYGHILTTEFLQQIDRLSNTKPFTQPFDVMEALKALPR